MFFNKLIALLSEPVRRNIIFFVFMYVLGIANALIETVLLQFKIPYFVFLSQVFDVYLLCLFVCFFSLRYRKYIVTLFSLICYILCIINVFCVYRFNAKLGPQIYNLVLETNYREAGEFFDNYININILFSPIIFLFLILLMNIVVYLCKNRIQRLIKTSSIAKFLSYNMGNVCIGVMVLFCSAVCLDSRTKMVRILCAPDILTVDKFVDNKTLNTPAYNLLFAIKMRQLSEEGLNILVETQENAYVDSCRYTSNNIVLIIGESYIRDHSQLYGYDKETTPNQLARTENSDSSHLVYFDNVISPSNLTSTVFKNVLSIHSVDDSLNSWESFPLFPVLFRKAGFQVTFITNQYVQSLGTDVFNFSGGMFLNDNRLSELQFDHRNVKAHRYDEDLLIDYDSLNHFSKKNNLMIFHLAGQHFEFYKRFPNHMKVFSTQDYSGRTDLSDGERQIVADYDNATRYNDYVLDEIIKRFEDKDAIVIYMPDHGEECYDEIHRMGRMPGGSFSAAMARQEYRIPFWIWCSKKYILAHPQIYNSILKNKNRPFMTDDISHMLLFLAGIETSYYNDKRNILSEKFDVNRPRLIEGKVDYDRLVSVK